MSETVKLSLQDLHVLAATAERNGTQDAFLRAALQWADAANEEIERLRADRERLTHEAHSKTILLAEKDGRILDMETDIEGLSSDYGRVVRYLDEITKWQTEGEELFENPDRIGFLFSMGVWWGERPWKRQK
jgi:hypothetical protein